MARRHRLRHLQAQIELLACRVEHLTLLTDQHSLALTRIEERVTQILAAVVGDGVVGIDAKPGVPVVRKSPRTGEVKMAKTTCTKVKKSACPAPAPTGGAGAPPSDDFLFIDGEDSTVTVSGKTARGNPVDISAVATIAVTSSDPAVITVAVTEPMKFTMSAVAAGGPVTLDVVATWTDGSRGPFSFALPVTVKPGGATGLELDVGTPTVR